MAARKKKYATAEEMGAAQREISVAEFFAKNRHLLGFDNASKALLTTVREAVDNALDACEEAGILPDIVVRIETVKRGGKKGGAGAGRRRGFAKAQRLKVSIRDNGPGIVEEQIPRIFGKLLYGSKFHRLRMSRGQQGIGISAAGLYAQLTTGRPVVITSRPGRRKPHRFRVSINLTKNVPERRKLQIADPRKVRAGTLVELEIEGRYHSGPRSVDEYLMHTAVANPHARLECVDPDGGRVVHERAVRRLPAPTREIKPHPYGVELGVLIRMMRDTKARSVASFLAQEFSRVSPRVAAEILERAGVDRKAKPHGIARTHADAIYAAIQETRIMAPRTDCLSPIGEKQLLKGLQKEFEADFYTSATRPPTVYRGNPFQVEVALAYGGELAADETAQLLRFANRVPLLYQAGACAITRAVQSVSWRNYHVHQSRGALPVGPLVLAVHVASVWVPFTSEAKEAVAGYDEILKEIRLAVQECGRRVGIHVNRQRRAAEEARKRGHIELFLPHISAALQEILGFPDAEKKRTDRKLKTILDRTRKQ